MSNNKIQTVAAALLLSVLLAACSAGGRQQRLAQLEELERRNQSDSLMTDDSLALALADWFDSHGTPGERLRAHYILGRTYADLGEAPAAVNAYQDAADCADTTAADCDWEKLSRVYGQMSDVFYRQNLLEDYLASLDKSVACAWKARDTSQALTGTMHKCVAYNQQHQYEKSLKLFEETYSHLVATYGDSIASQFCPISAKSLLAMNQPEAARNYLEAYEQKSGFFDREGNIIPGHETYYYYKGQYFLAMRQYDSAIICFSSELAQGKDFLNQEMASHGLAVAYSVAGNPDSAAQYALYSYAMTDSLYSQMAMAEVAHTKALYDYSHQQAIARKEHEKAERELTRSKALLLLVVTALAFIGILSALVVILAKRRRMSALQYKARLEELRQAKTDLEGLMAKQKESAERIERMEQLIAMNRQELDALRSHKEEFGQIIARREQEIAEKEDEVIKIEGEVIALQAKVAEKEMAIAQLHEELYKSQDEDSLRLQLVNAKLAESSIYQHLHHQETACLELSDDEWQEIRNLIKELLPDFFASISKYPPESYEHKICLLFRMHIGVKDAGGFIGTSTPYVSRISSEILLRDYQTTGSGKLLKKKLEELSK